MKVKIDEPKNVLYPKGTIIWREVEFDPNTGRVVEPKEFWKDSDRQDGCQVCGFAKTPGNGIWEPETSDSGVVLFIEEEPPEDWTYLIVKGCTTKLRTDPRGGALLVATPPKDEEIDMATYIKWREDYIRMVYQYDNEPFEKILEKARLIGDPGLKFGQRLIALPGIPETTDECDRNVAYEFEFITLNHKQPQRRRLPEIKFA